MATGLLLSIPSPGELFVRSHEPLLPILLLFLLSLTVYLIHSIRKDYHAFLALGPGGTPSTPTGYLRICTLRLIALRNPLAPPSLPTALHPQQGYLHPSTLPPRQGPRPTVAGIAPQRQMTQRGGLAMYPALTAQIHKLALQSPHKLYTATSCFEKHSTGIFCRILAEPKSTTQNQNLTQTQTQTQSNQCQCQCQGPKNQSPSQSPSQVSLQIQRKLRLTCNGEVCHSHPSDGSLHLTLHPADVRLVLERGWAQRHPLARESWWWAWTRIVPSGFVMVYAPRNAEELESVTQIIRAATWWVSGEELQ